MKIIMAVIAILSFGVASPAQADINDTSFTGFSSNFVCVQPPTNQAGTGFRIQRAIQYLNDQQDIVDVQYGVTANCVNTIDMKIVTPAEAIVWPSGGYAWYGDQFFSYSYNRWAYTEAFVHLVDANPNRREEKCYAISLVIHEVGHALGLPHSDLKRSIMHPDYNHDRFCGKIGPSDFRELDARY